MPVHDVFVVIPVSIHMTHSLILIDYQLSLLCIKWPALLALENINYHALYFLWLHVRLIQNFRATTVTHVQAKVCLAPCLLSKGITLTQHLEAFLLHQSPVTAEVVQAAALHGAASRQKHRVGERRCRYTWVCTWRILGLDNCLSCFPACSALSWAPPIYSPCTLLSERTGWHR